MARVRVKICGIRTMEEASAALDLGADAVGFNFWPKSPRYIEPDLARKIIVRLSPLVSCIGVFVNERPENVLETARTARLDGVQLHGDESADYCDSLEGIRIIKAVRVTDGLDLSVLEKFPATAFLLDTHIKGEYGGTGRRFDWRLAAEAARRARIILAGGLTTDNVATAVATVKPYAVDVSSGVEASPGKKDHAKMRAFVQAAKLVPM